MAYTHEGLLWILCATSSHSKAYPFIDCDWRWWASLAIAIVQSLVFAYFSLPNSIFAASHRYVAFDHNQFKIFHLFLFSNLLLEKERICWSQCWCYFYNMLYFVRILYLFDNCTSSWKQKFRIKILEGCRLKKDVIMDCLGKD